MTRRRRALVAVAAGVLLATSCGGGDNGEDAGEALAETATKLGEIRSGVLDVRLVVEPRGSVGERVGFELNGPFSLGEQGRPTEFRIEYTQLRGDEAGTVSVTAAGGDAYVTVGDDTYRLRQDQTRALVEAGEAVAADGGLGELRIEDWLVEPELSDGNDVAGDPTDRIEARLDVAAAARDLVELANSAGAEGVNAFSAEEANRLRDAADDARIEVLTGEDDRLLRHVSIHVDLAFGVPRELRSLFGSVVGGTLELELTIENPNEPVAIEPPSNARPASELPGG